jgi:hypothetical protein
MLAAFANTTSAEHYSTPVGEEGARLVHERAELPGRERRGVDPLAVPVLASGASGQSACREPPPPVPASHRIPDPVARGHGTSP